MKYPRSVLCLLLLFRNWCFHAQDFTELPAACTKFKVRQRDPEIERTWSTMIHTPPAGMKGELRGPFGAVHRDSGAQGCLFWSRFDHVLCPVCMCRLFEASRKVSAEVRLLTPRWLCMLSEAAPLSSSLQHICSRLRALFPLP